MGYISKAQLLTLTILFEIGTTTLFALGIKAKQDAWITILISMLVGFIFLWIYIKLQSAFPDKNLIQIIILILGKGVGVPLALFYAIFLIYPSGRNLFHLCQLTKLTFLPLTPLSAITAMILLAAVYAFFLGIEVFARTSQILLPLYLLFIVSIYIMAVASGIVDLKNLTPVLGAGIKPVLLNVYPTTISFPFCEMFIFTMYWYRVSENSEHTIRNASFLGVVISTVIIISSILTNISVLGVHYTSVATIPFLEVIKLINIGDIITNLDSLGVIIMFIGGFYKTCIYFYACIMAFATVFNIKNSKLFSIPLAIFIFWYSMIAEPNYPFLIWMTDINAYFLLIPLYQIIPVLLLLIYWLKKKTGKLSVIKNNLKDT